MIRLLGRVADEHAGAFRPWIFIAGRHQKRPYFLHGVARWCLHIVTCDDRPQSLRQVFHIKHLSFSFCDEHSFVLSNKPSLSNPSKALSQDFGKVCAGCRAPYVIFWLPLWVFYILPSFKSLIIFILPLLFRLHYPYIRAEAHLVLSSSFGQRVVAFEPSHRASWRLWRDGSLLADQSYLTCYYLILQRLLF